jgi:hypothetical protein
MKNYRARLPMEGLEGYKNDVQTYITFNLSYRYINDLLSANNSNYKKHVHRVYPE